MIIKANKEILADVKGYGLSSLDEYINKADEMTRKWIDRNTMKSEQFPIQLDDNLCATYMDNSGCFHTSDISQFAFGQMCSKVGVPASYIEKCFNHGLPELAVHNYREWSRLSSRKDNSVLVREYDGTVRAVLSDRYNVFNTASVLNNVRKAVSNPHLKNRYEMNQIFMDTDKLHIRFVDFNNPIRSGITDLHPGFTVSSSDVGNRSLNIKYFLYRFACRNGLVIIQNGGTLFWQSHIRNFESDGAELFETALLKIEDMNEYARNRIISAEKKRLSKDEMRMYLEKAQKELHLGKKIEEVESLMQTTYTDNNLMSFVNAVTEHAQNYTLDTRIEQETWAGKILSAVAA